MLPPYLWLQLIRTPMSAKRGYTDMKSLLAKSRIGMSTGLVMALMGAWNVASAAVINFDVDTNNAAIANGTVINTTYTTLGVTLSSIRTCPTCTTAPTPGQDAFADRAGVPHSSPNVFGIAADMFVFDSRWGAGVAKFATPQQDVGIYAAAVPFVENLGQPEKAKPFLTAYDSLGNFLGAAALYGPNEGDSNYGTYQKLVVHTSIADIAEVHFSSQQPSQFAGPNSIVYGIFDDLAFGTDVSLSSSSWNALANFTGPGASAGPDSNSSVPEPGSLLLIGAALMSLVGFRKKTSK